MNPNGLHTAPFQKWNRNLTHPTRLHPNTSDEQDKNAPPKNFQSSLPTKRDTLLTLSNRLAQIHFITLTVKISFCSLRHKLFPHCFRKTTCLRSLGTKGQGTGTAGVEGGKRGAGEERRRRKEVKKKEGNNGCAKEIDRKTHNVFICVSE